jgi:CheY-like chemotaxis protein
VLAERQKDHALQAIPAIVLSTASAQQNQSRAMAVGAQHYLEKSRDFDYFVQQVKIYCGPFLRAERSLPLNDSTTTGSLQNMDTAIRQRECSGITQPQS